MLRPHNQVRSQTHQPWGKIHCQITYNKRPNIFISSHCLFVHTSSSSSVKCSFFLFIIRLILTHPLRPCSDEISTDGFYSSFQRRGQVFKSVSRIPYVEWLAAFESYARSSSLIFVFFKCAFKSCVNSLSLKNNRHVVKVGSARG